MADFTYSEGAMPRGGATSRLAHMTGAAASLALIVGIGVWGYKLIARDVSGVPVVIAMEGPIRVAPETPGGQLADHQGLAVNAVAGHGTAAPPADRLVLAPVPAGLAEEDVALGQITPVQPAPLQATLNQTLTPQPAPALSETAQPSIPDDSPLAQNEALAAIVDQLAAGAVPLTPLAPGEDIPVTTQIVGQEPVAFAPGDGLARSLRPKSRPVALQTASVDPVAAVLTQAAASEIDAASLPAGTRLVQIGAFDTPDDARTAWTKLNGRFSDYLADKERVIQKATSGGRVFYRLRAHGFADLSDARRFCAALVSGNVDCIPVVTR